VCILPVLALGACADYLNHGDTVTSSAGNAVAHNMVVHTADPWPPAAADTRIAGNGQRVDTVTKKYLAGPTIATTTSSSSSSTPSSPSNDKSSGNQPSQ
jgi:hypothetical protein